MTKTSIVYGGILRGWHRLILKMEGGPGRLQPVPPSHGEIEDYGASERKRTVNRKRTVKCTLQGILNGGLRSDAG